MNQCWYKKKGSDYKTKGPFSRDEYFKGVPDDLDAAVYNSDTNYYWFFKGGQCWSKKKGADKEVKGPFTRAQHFKGVPDDLDAAVYNSDTNYYWFFKGDECWNKKKGADNEVKGPFTRSQHFKGVPNDLDSAVYNSDTNYYWFFKSSKCWSKKKGSDAVNGPFSIHDAFLSDNEYNMFDLNSTSNFIISVPHGGKKGLADIYRRTKDDTSCKNSESFSHATDKDTIKVGTEIIRQYNRSKEVSSLRHISYVIAEVDRDFIDFNRSESCAIKNMEKFTSTYKLPKKIYNQYYNIIEEFSRVGGNESTFLFDIHGFGKKGTYTDILLGTRGYTTMLEDNVIALKEHINEELEDKGSSMRATIIPPDKTEYQGGHIVKTYSNYTKTKSDQAVQIELSLDIRQSNDARMQFAKALASALINVDWKHRS